MAGKDERMSKRIEVTLPGDMKVMLRCVSAEQEAAFADWLRALEDDPAMMADFCEALLESGLSEAMHEAIH